MQKYKEKKIEDLRNEIDHLEKEIREKKKILSRIENPLKYCQWHNCSKKAYAICRERDFHYCKKHYNIAKSLL